MTTLETDRLVIRPWRVGDMDDAKALFRYASKPKVGPAAAWPAHHSVKESAVIIRDVFSAPETYAVTLRTTGEPVGSIGLTQLSDIAEECVDGTHNATELGYWIGEPFWGQGLIPEAGREMLRHGFADLGLTSIWGTHDVSNAQSARVMDKLGLRLIRIRHHVHLELLGDVYRDEAIRRTTRDEWGSHINAPSRILTTAL